MAWYDHLPRLGCFNEIPASMMDRAYLDNDNGFFANLATFFKIRAIYVFLFVPLSVIDMAASAVAAVLTCLATVFTSDDTQDFLIEQMKNFENLFSKNFYSLLATPIGLFSPKLTAFAFTPSKKTDGGVRAGGGYYQDEQATQCTPASISDVQGIIRKAHASGRTVIPKGAGYSQGKQFLPEAKDGVVLDLRLLNTIEISADHKTAKVGAGVIWSDLQKEANKHKLALKVMQAPNIFSVGGSIGTNIHGWDHQTGMLSNTIREMTIVNPEGNLQTITPADALFHHITGGLGLFGVVVSVTMDLTDNLRLVEKGEEIAIADYVEYFQQAVLPDQNKKMHLYRLSLDPNDLLGSGVAVSYEEECEGAPPETALKLEMERPEGTRLDRFLVNLVRRFPWMQNFYWTTTHDRLLANNSPSMTTNEIMKPMINAMFNSSVSEAEWLQEFFLPGENLNEFLQKLGTILMDNDTHLLNASVRFVKQNDESAMSYAHDGDRYAVVLCWNQSLRPADIIKAKKWLRTAQKLTVDMNGAYYLPYQQVSSPQAFEQSYPHAKEAMAFKKEIDPLDVFSSGFAKKYMDPMESENYLVKMMRTEESKQEFAGFLNNVLQRVDADAFFRLLDDIMSYNDTHAEIYQELCQRLPEIMPSTVEDISHVLHSLSTIKGDLGAQAQALLPATVRDINGLVEIGYPGRFIHGFQSRYRVSGQITAVCEQESLTDYLQTGYPRPYDTFVTLDYLQPGLAGLENDSADVITCYVGLHHFPAEQLDVFLEEVRRVLRPGGHFLLVDHDVTDEKTMTYAHMAHSVFNAVTGASLSEEMHELRDFKSMDQWREKLAEHGLLMERNAPDVPMIRQGDPSRNRMVSVAKIPAVRPPTFFNLVA